MVVDVPGFDPRGYMIGLPWRKGRIRSAERVEAHLFSIKSSATFFQPDVRTPGASMKGGRYVD